MSRNRNFNVNLIEMSIYCLSLIPQGKMELNNIANVTSRAEGFLCSTKESESDSASCDFPARTKGMHKLCGLVVESSIIHKD